KNPGGGPRGRAPRPPRKGAAAPLFPPPRGGGGGGGGRDVWVLGGGGGVLLGVGGGGGGGGAGRRWWGGETGAGGGGESGRGGGRGGQGMTKKTRPSAGCNRSRADVSLFRFGTIRWTPLVGFRYGPPLSPASRQTASTQGPVALIIWRARMASWPPPMRSTA